MATCKQICDNINEYLENILTPEQNKTVEKHIKECPNCEIAVNNGREMNRFFEGMKNQKLDSSRMKTSIPK